MRTVLRLILITFSLVLALVAVLLVNTFLLGGAPKTPQVALPKTPEMQAELAMTHLSEAIRIKTISTGRTTQGQAADQPWLELHDWLARTYPTAHETMTREVVPGGQTLLYTWKGSEESLNPLLFMAHQDVVPVNKGTRKDWKGDPFAGEIIDGTLYGRGAIDDKGSLVALMEVAETLAKNGFKPKRTIYFLFGHDEEVGGRGAQAAIALLKKRGVKPEMALDEGSWIIDPSPLTGKRTAFIGVAEKGYISIKIEARAKGGHSSIPPRNTAVVKISKAVLALENNQMPVNLTTPPISDMLAASIPEMPLLNRVIFSNLWLTKSLVDAQMSKLGTANALIRTTTAPTMLRGSAKENVLAQRASAVINFRIHPNDSIQSVVAHVKKVTAHIPGLEVKPNSIFGGKPSPISPINSQAYAVLASVAREAGDGAPVAPLLVLGATDARYAYAITDKVYRFAPSVITSEDISGIHGTNERFSTENMGRLLKGYAQIILAMDK